MRPDKFRKAQKLMKSGKVVSKGLIGSSIYFTVKSNKDRHVIFRVPGQTWICDCEYYVLKGKECSHMIACKMLLKEQEKQELKK
ncbi:MAG: hypothetical protein GOU99_02295 [Candidatus Altiarchaeota archaeon]|nr:hypothetical protein [Candidatus Altiarchaeota archaeon]